MFSLFSSIFFFLPVRTGPVVAPPRSGRHVRHALRLLAPGLLGTVAIDITSCIASSIEPGRPATGKNREDKEKIRKIEKKIGFRRFPYFFIFFLIFFLFSLFLPVAG